MDARFVGLARAIFNDDPVLVNVKLFANPAQVDSEVPYHQDNAYFTMNPDHAVTIWLALADATTENGCVRYVERSHKFGNLSHRPSGVKENSMRLCDVPPNAGGEVCGSILRGGVLIHHCNTIHRSEPNRSELNRPGLLLVCKTARCRSDPILAKTYQNAASLV
jgi:phytanoyl-CoA hydroxylase